MLVSTECVTTYTQPYRYYPLCTQMSHYGFKTRLIVSTWGSVCNVSYRIREKVPNAIYVKIPLNQIDAF